MIDVTILTDKRFDNPTEITPYIQNVLDEDNALLLALERKELRVIRTYWDNPNFDWSSTKYVIFRTTWDYFDRFEEFSQWLNAVSKQTKLCNPYAIIKWNMDKHYLKDLESKGIPVTPSRFVEKGSTVNIEDAISKS